MASRSHDYAQERSTGPDADDFDVTADEDFLLRVGLPIVATLGLVVVALIVGAIAAFV